MKPGDLVHVSKFGELRFTGTYLGPTRRFDPQKLRHLGRFLTYSGNVIDVDLGNNPVWSFQVIE